MRKVDNGFVKFMCKLDGKTYKPKTRVKHPWPGEFNTGHFLDLIFTITSEYRVGESLGPADSTLLDLAISWDTTHIGHKLDYLYDGGEITHDIMEVFQGWRKRLENGEAPNRREFVTEEEFPF